MSLALGSRLGPYEIHSLIGSGGMGEVYRAHDTKLNRDVALKILPEQFATDLDRLARFKREAQVLASLNIPTLRSFTASRRWNGIQAFVKELVEDPTLADRIGHGLMIEALPIARPITEPLETGEIAWAEGVSSSRLTNVW